MHEPKCQYFGRCAGCSTQHLPYDLQLKNKTKNISQFLSIPQDQIKVFSGNEYGYRNRMDFIFHPGGLGLREKDKGNHIIDIDSCPISDTKVNNILLEIRDFFKDSDAYDPKDKTGTFRYMVIRTATVDTGVAFILNEDSSQTAEAIEKIRQFAEMSAVKNIVVGYTAPVADDTYTDNLFVVKGSEYIKEVFLGKSLLYHSLGFFQNNSQMAERMIAYVKSLFSVQKGTLIDLYGGVGGFGLCLSDLFEKVLIVEEAPKSIECAQKNIELNDIKNAEAIVLDAQKVNKLKYVGNLSVITDPPRSGMNSKAIERLNKLNAQAIIYISCNPQQFKKELPYFVRAGYRLNSCALFDLFPQTNHCEVVTELRK